MDMSRPRSGGRLAAVLGITVLVGTACGAQHDAVTTPSQPPPTPIPVAVPVSAGVAGVVAAEDRFGVDLLAGAGQPNENLVVSPASVSLALQMVQSGAAGTTATEMARVLHLPDATGAAGTAARQLLESLATVANDRRNTLRVANTVWTQRNMAIEESYASTLSRFYTSALRQADFVANPGQATDQINKTVAGQTNGMIPRLFPAGTLDDTTRMVVANATYLAASWATAFDPKQTAPGPFTRADGTVVRVPMMRQDQEPDPDQPPPFGYAQGSGYQAVTLPYVGGKLAFTVLLPAGRSLAPLLDTLRTNGLPSILNAVRPTDIDLEMPKFTVSSDIDLKGTLAALGMPTAFTDQADFSGITGDERLKIQTVRHDAVVKVDEHGTTAAAATGVGMRATAMPVRAVVDVNRPFLFVITDTTTGAPLFLGQVTDPTG
jgi:serpin B